MRVIFVGGQGRSGSTLIERVLGELPGVRALGEAVHVWQDQLHTHQRCGCGAWFSACDFWTAVGDRAFGGWHNVDRQRILRLWSAVACTRSIPLLVRPGASRLAMIGEFASYQARVYAAAAEVSGARAVVDSTKYPALAYCLRRAREFDLRVVHLVRDPRGVAYSWTKQVARPETDGRTMVPTYRPSRSALRWSAHNAALDLLSRLGRPGAGRVPVHRTRYEDFLADPRGTVRALAAFAGLPLDPADLSFLGADHAELGPVHSASGNPMRFATGRTRLRRDDAWRTELPAGQRRLVSAICAPQLAAYGYPPFSRAG
jgi:hypothetical protein